MTSSFQTEFFNLVASAVEQGHAFPEVHPPFMTNIGTFEKAFEAFLPEGSPVLEVLEGVELDMLPLEELLRALFSFVEQVMRLPETEESLITNIDLLAKACNASLDKIYPATPVPADHSYTRTWPASEPAPSFEGAPMATRLPSELRETLQPE